MVRFSFVPGEPRRYPAQHMRYRLSTVLLTMLSVAILLGWLTDKSIQRHSEESIVQREGTAAAIYFRSQAALDAARSRTIDHIENAEIALVWAVIDLCRNESVYNATTYSLTGDAVGLANLILRRLECDSGQTFRTRAMSLYPFQTQAAQDQHIRQSSALQSGSSFPQNEKRFPELYDSSSDEYKQLENFIMRALTPEQSKVAG